MTKKCGMSGRASLSLVPSNIARAVARDKLNSDFAFNLLQRDEDTTFIVPRRQSRQRQTVNTWFTLYSQLNANFRNFPNKYRTLVKQILTGAAEHGLSSQQMRML